MRTIVSIIATAAVLTLVHCCMQVAAQMACDNPKLWCEAKP